MLILEVVAGCAAVAMLGLLIYALTQISSLSGSVADIAQKAGKARTISNALEQRLAKVEQQNEEIVKTLGRLETKLQSVGREVFRVNAASASSLSQVSAIGEADPGRSSTSGEVESSSPVPISRYADSGTGITGAEASPVRLEDGDVEPEGVGSDMFGPLLDEYRLLIAQPRRNEISRWLEDQGGLSCEAGEDDVLQLVGRGEGGRLTLLPVTAKVALIVPSALLVVDFATSFSDVLSARSALRNTFALDPDGTGVLRLLDPAIATLKDGVWKLRQAGRLGGLAGS